MDEDQTPNPVQVGAMAAVCGDTLNGWLWYCDVHDTHGNADFEDEAALVASAHRDFYGEDQDDQPCDIVIWNRAEPERS